MRRRPRTGLGKVWAVGLAGLVLVAGVGVAWFVLRGHSTTPAPGSRSLTFDQQVQHVFVIMLENHAYSNLFGTYCTKVGPYCSNTSVGLPKAGACLPYNLSQSSPCVSLYPFAPNELLSRDICHTWNCSHTAWDGGRMDGFVAATKNNTYSMGYYDDRTVPAYWQWAEQYAIGDEFFSSALSYTLPNHWFLLAGAAPNTTLQNGYTNFDSNGQLTAVGQTYLDQANATPTIADELQAHGLSWGYFDDHGLTFAPGGYGSAIRNGQTWTYTDPFAAKASSYSSAYAPHLSNSTTLLRDLQNGTAPNVSWIIPSKTLSEHPPQNVENGMNWTVSIVNAIEASRVWNSSVVFVTFDEYGGFYDRVAPPQIDAYGLGFRVPFLVIGPYVREGYIGGQLGYFESILRFIEERYGLSPLTQRDANAPSLLSYFDFARPPRAPIITVPASGYPVPLQTLPP